MFSFEASNIHHAVYEGLTYLLANGVRESSRNGDVLVAPGPVCTVYTSPLRRVLLSPTRDANPFFHFFEALWMINGDNDIDFPCWFTPQYAQYSDDGKTMWDAYGYRWRKFFGWDQLPDIAEELKKNPNTRRAVLSMWNAACIEDATFDDNISDFYVAARGGKAVPCNTHAYFDARGGKLNMTVCCRSNDMIFGGYGANAVHFSYLLEHMSVLTGYPVGVYRQFSNNFHTYLEKFPIERLEILVEESKQLAGEDSQLSTVPMDLDFVDGLPVFMSWARRLKNNEVVPVLETGSALLDTVAQPMLLAWATRQAHKKEGTDWTQSTFDWASQIAAQDWNVAVNEWLKRRVA